MNEFDFFNLKTDLADESDEILRAKTPHVPSVESKRRTLDGINIFEMNIKNSEGERLSGKKMGRYITLDI
jgi:hypothetical protein